MKYVFIVNPTANQGEAANIISNIDLVCTRRELNFIIHTTRYPGHATELVKNYRNEDCIIYSVGGDGTLNEVVNGLMKYPNTLGVIPAGSGNDFYRTVKSFDEDYFYTDVGIVNDKFFINVAGIGLDAEIGVNAEKFKKTWVPKGQIYNASILYTYFRYKDKVINYKIDGVWNKSHATVFNICNGRYYGKGFKIAPKAKLNDGLFDVYSANKLSKFKIPGLIMKLSKGEHHGNDAVDYYRTKNIVITTDEKTVFGFDGEVLYDNKFTISMAKKQLKVFNYKELVEEIMGYKKYSKKIINKKVILDFPDVSIYSFIKDACLNHSKFTAYEYFGVKKTYIEFLKEIDRTARAYLSFGVKKGDVVSIVCPNIPEGVISFYALNKIGAISSMIHPLSAPNEIEHYLKTSNSKYVLALDMAYNNFKHILPNTNVLKTIIVSVSNSMGPAMEVGYKVTKGLAVKKIEYSDNVIKYNKFYTNRKKHNEELEIKSKKEDIACILYSGGTSGKPKGIKLTNLSFNAMAMQAYETVTEVRKGYKFLGIMPIFHGFGLGVGFHTMFFIGLNVVMMPTFSSKDFDKILEKHKPNVLVGIPTLYEAILNNKNISKMDLSFLKIVISGGDNMSLVSKKKLDELLFKSGSSAAVLEGYGLTESLAAVCLSAKRDYDEYSIGYPWPNNEFKIVNPETNIELPYLEDGEIVLRGPTVMASYINREDNKESLRLHSDGNYWLHTGDMGFMDETGKIYFKQRLKRMIVSTGFNVYPSLIESVINENKNVVIASVVGVSHPYKGQVPKAFVVLKDDVNKRKVKKEIMDSCKKNLPNWSVPSDIVFRDDLPRTKLGKVAFTELE